MQTEEKIIRLKSGFSMLENSVSNLTEAVLFYKPSTASWNIHEVIEHIFVVEHGTSRILRMSGRSQESTWREIVGETAIITYLANPAPIQAPEAVMPKGRFANNQQELMQKFSETRMSLISDIEQNTLIFGDDTVKHPLLGDMTKRDWLNFTILHAERHLQQIERLKNQALSSGM